MTDRDDNVIPFPDRGVPREVAEAIAQQLGQPGHDPTDVLARLLSSGRPLDDILPPRSQPALAPPPAAPSRYRVRVDLDGARPPIWRRLELASDLTLAELHEVLQVAMGWTDSHLHHFTTGSKRDYSVMPFLTDFDEEEGDEGINERGVRLDQVLVTVGDRLRYEYDFGDGWEHTVRLERVEHLDDTAPRERVLGGRRGCPPEDCGGIGGYEELVAALREGPSDDEHRHGLLHWLGDDWDPEAFSVEETNQVLQLALASPGGTGLAATLDGLDADLTLALGGLVDLSRPEPGPLAALLATAELSRGDEPDPETKARMVGPWQHLLHVVGSGLRLTSAGWLPPAVVSRLASELELLEPWMGKGNREEHTLPVRLLRETASALRLLRKRKGELLPTVLGRRLADDPEALWRHVAHSLPMGREACDQHAGAIMLLSVAAGHTPYDGIDRYGADLLRAAGWTEGDGRPVSRKSALELARPTWDVLRAAGCSPDVLRDETITPEIRQLARAALRPASS